MSSIVSSSSSPVYSLEEQKILFWITKPLAVCSIVCSCVAIYHLLLDRKTRLGKIYGRLWFLISFTNVLVAFFSIVAGFATPKDTGVYGAFGNETSCQVMGATFMFCFVLCMGYNAALAVFFFMSIHTKWTERDFAREVEPWLHIIPFCYAITGVTVGLTTHMFSTNDFFNYCWAAPSPFGCRYNNDGGEDTCEHGRNDALRSVFNRSETRQEKKMQAKYHAKSTGNTIAKETGKQALVSFYTCIIPYGCMILLRVMDLFFWQKEIVQTQAFFWFSVLAQVFFPCQGILNMICYFRPKIKERQRKLKGDNKETILHSLLVLLEMRKPTLTKPNRFAAPGGTYGGTSSKPNDSSINLNTASSTGSEKSEVEVIGEANTDARPPPVHNDDEEEEVNTMMGVVEDVDNDVDEEDADVNDVGYLDVTELERAAGGRSFVLGEEMIGDIQKRILESIEQQQQHQQERISGQSRPRFSLSSGAAAARHQRRSGDSISRGANQQQQQRPRLSEESIPSITEHTEEKSDDSLSSSSATSAKRVNMTGEVIGKNSGTRE